MSTENHGVILQRDKRARRIGGVTNAAYPKRFRGAGVGFQTRLFPQLPEEFGRVELDLH